MARRHNLAIQKLKNMKTIFTLLLFVASFTTTAQTYTELTAANSAYIENMTITFEKGDSMIVLNNNNVTPARTYYLENQTSVNFVMPVLPSGWSIVILRKQHLTSYEINTGAAFRYVLDNNFNSYPRLH